MRLERSGGGVVTDLRGKFAEAASRGLVYALMTALAGTTIVAANVAPPAAAAATVLSIWNPIGSGFNLELIRAWLHHISGTPGAGMWAWCQAFNVEITATETAIPLCTLNGRRGFPVGFTQSALTGGLVHKNIRPFGSAQFAGAIAATTPGQVVIDQAEGDIIVPPGGLLTLAPPAAGSAHIVAAGLEVMVSPV